MNLKKNAIRSGVFAGVVAGMLAGSATAAVLTVVNPGFEGPDASAGDIAGTTGWATVAGGAYTTAGAHRSGTQAGKAFGNPGLFQQTISTGSDPVGTVYTASIYGLNNPADPLAGSMGGFINIDFLNSSGTVLATITGGEQGSMLTSADPQGVFKLVSVTGPSVAGTASVRIDLVAGPYSPVAGAPGGAAFFDDASLTNNLNIPEPASLAVLGLAGGALLRRRRQA